MVERGSFFARLVTLHIPLWGFVSVTLFPFFWMFITSIKSDRELYNLKVNPIVVLEPTLKHYRMLFEETEFVTWLANTMVVAVVATFTSLLCAIGAGYALARLKFRGSTVIGLIIFVTYLIPTSLLFLPLAQIIQWLGLSNSRWALILTYPTFLIPFCAWLLMGYFKTIPRELEECAMIDGASRVRALWSIILPLALPGVLSAGIFAFTLSWNEFIYALVFLSSPETKTIPIGVVSELIKGDIFYWGALMAGALLGSVPIALLYSFLVEHFVGGMTTGAVKG
jgi:multiple sugar transport system permease protein